jgi:hypothetical protein
MQKGNEVSWHVVFFLNRDRPTVWSLGVYRSSETFASVFSSGFVLEGCIVKTVAR